jgi:hypothetical protein
MYLLYDGLVSLDIDRGDDTPASLLVCRPKDMKAALKTLLAFLEKNL